MLSERFCMLPPALSTLNEGDGTSLPVDWVTKRVSKSCVNAVKKLKAGKAKKTKKPSDSMYKLTM